MVVKLKAEKLPKSKLPTRKEKSKRLRLQIDNSTLTNKSRSGIKTNELVTSIDEKSSKKSFTKRRLEYKEKVISRRTKSLVKGIKDIKTITGIAGKAIILEKVLDTLLDTVGKRELIVNFSTRKSIDEVRDFHNNLVAHLGTEFGTKKYKSTTNYCIQLLEGIENPTVVDRLSTGLKDKWPNALGSLRPLFHQVRDGGPYRKVGDQVIRTLFGMQRTLEGFTKLNLEKIEYSAPIDEDFLKEYNEFVINLYKENGLLREGDFKDNEYIIEPPLSVSASGPNKVPKTESAAYEAHLLINSKELFSPFREMCIKTKNEEFLTFVKHMASKYKDVNEKIRNANPSKNKFINTEEKKAKASLDKEISLYSSPNVSEGDTSCLRKITAVPDSGNKSRTIAISDYWTQCLLTPFESKILESIKTLYPDSSNIFDHSGGFNKLMESIKVGTTCIDAESWTDTFSEKFQRSHVECLFGREFRTNWTRLVVKCKWSVKGTNQFVFYKTGQGMGTKGSFAAASIAYLTLMEFLTRKHYPELISSNLKERSFIKLSIK